MRLLPNNCDRGIVLCGWERGWSLYLDRNKKLQKSDFGKYGMEPTENIFHILNIMDIEFGSEMKGEEFFIYVDYYKEVKIEW
jgi:hypothetical protein